MNHICRIIGKKKGGGGSLPFSGYLSVTAFGVNILMLLHFHVTEVVFSPLVILNKHVFFSKTFMVNNTIERRLPLISGHFSIQTSMHFHFFSLNLWIADTCEKRTNSAVLKCSLFRGFYCIHLNLFIFVCTPMIIAKSVNIKDQFENYI